MESTFTAVYRRVPEGYAGFVEELPGANSQGTMLEEARENLREAVALVLEASRSLAEEQFVHSRNRVDSQPHHEAGKAGVVLPEPAVDLPRAPPRAPAAAGRSAPAPLSAEEGG